MSSTPTLPVLDVRKAVTFYKAAGFGARMYEDMWTRGTPACRRRASR